ncbi:MAG TPA: aminotransferase class IV [Anaerohalosphaeraceae bacterium]|nr:aminotransferase class IV [Phycisphaerae bacterium]HOK95099.1 aminotransferase class IV [Anaerohalosphaeraceae bacterium]HOL31226.1 aminotransferase class IV [Anaerohalosphaeraceae bacterium]HOM76503.1 aminotransferase class IV [Anaerohalosphaeraceae bacterium]HPC63837.1 aminotransferase class IV [Anaerohalosphaeraceae bacterium]
MDVAMIDDQMLPMCDLAKPYLDRGLYFGDGVYEVIRSYDGQIFALDEHLNRFERSLREIQINTVNLSVIKQKIVAAVERSGYSNAKIYFHITRGSEPRDHLPSDGLLPNFFMTVSQLHDSPEVKEKGIAVAAYPDLRWKRCDIKSLNLLPNVLARIEVKKQGASEAILVGDDGTITEGAGSAFFAVNGKEKVIITRPLGHEILPSITRMMILPVAQNAGLAVVEKTLTPQQAAQCDELFIAVTTKDIVPVAYFNGKPISGGRCGQWTGRLIREFREFVHQRRQ